MTAETADPTGTHAHIQQTGTYPVLPSPPPAVISGPNALKADGRKDGGTKPRQRGQKAKVEDYIYRRPGVQVTVGEVAATTGLERRQTSNALAALAREDRIDRGINRGTYVYRGPKVAEEKVRTTTSAIYEYVGNTGAGDAVIRDEDGVLFTVCPL